MECEVHNFEVKLFSKYFLFYTGFQQLTGDGVISNNAPAGQLLKYFYVVFPKVIEENRIQLFNLANGHLHDPEHGLYGIISFIKNPVCLVGRLLFIIHNYLQEQGILVFKFLIDGSFGYAHLLSKGIHGHASDAIFAKELARFYNDSFLYFQSIQIFGKYMKTFLVFLVFRSNF